MASTTDTYKITKEQRKYLKMVLTHFTICQSSNPKTWTKLSIKWIEEILVNNTYLTMDKVWLNDLKKYYIKLMTNE